MKYIIKGEPIGLINCQEHVIWNEAKAQRLNYTIQLRNQQAERPLLQGPIDVLLEFYFLAAQYSYCRRKKDSGYPHTEQPALGSLIKVIEDMGRGIIFRNNTHIAQISAKKYYDSEPRTEITIVSLKESDEKKE